MRLSLLPHGLRHSACALRYAGLPLDRRVSERPPRVERHYHYCYCHYHSSQQPVVLNTLLRSSHPDSKSKDKGNRDKGRDKTASLERTLLRRRKERSIRNIHESRNA